MMRGERRLVSSCSCVCVCGITISSHSMTCFAHDQNIFLKVDAQYSKVCQNASWPLMFESAKSMNPYSGTPKQLLVRSSKPPFYSSSHRAKKNRKKGFTNQLQATHLCWTVSNLLAVAVLLRYSSGRLWLGKTGCSMQLRTLPHHVKSWPRNSGRWWQRWGHHGPRRM